MQSRLSGVQGSERVELVTAAHTMVVLSACFEVVRESFQAEPLRDLRITDTEQAHLAAGRWREPGESLLSMLWAADVPMPNGARGFTETLEHVREWAEAFNGLVRGFVEGLEGGSRAIADSGFHPGPLAAQAAARYQSHYLRLAATVPDFWIWAQLGEHAATRAEIAEVAAAFEGPDAALSRVESLLATIVAGAPAVSRQAEALARANRDVLTRPLVVKATTSHTPSLPQDPRSQTARQNTSPIRASNNVARVCGPPAPVRCCLRRMPESGEDVDG